MINWHHILERELIHFFAAPGVFLMAFQAVDWGFTKWYKSWNKLFWLRMIIPAVFALLCIFLREPADVALVGDWFGKSYIDFGTWAVGLACGIWLFYRSMKRFSVDAIKH